MSEREGQRQGSPLDSERGTTKVEDAAVKRIAGRAASEVEGIHMGGSASRGAGGLLGRATGSSNNETRGVSVEVGRVETAIDLTMAVDYDKNILQVVGRVRDNVEEQIQNLTGHRITELNVTISDIISPDNNRGDGGGRSGEQRSESSARNTEDDTSPVRSREPLSRERTGRDDVYVEGTPMEEGETAELKLGGDVEKRPSGERGGERGGGRGGRGERGGGGERGEGRGDRGERGGGGRRRG